MIRNDHARKQKALDVLIKAFKEKKIAIKTKGFHIMAIGEDRHANWTVFIEHIGWGMFQVTHYAKDRYMIAARDKVEFFSEVTDDEEGEDA